MGFIVAAIKAWVICLRIQTGWLVTAVSVDPEEQSELSGRAGPGVPLQDLKGHGHTRLEGFILRRDVYAQLYCPPSTRRTPLRNRPNLIAGATPQVDKALRQGADPDIGRGTRRARRPGN
jgi:hypothetical protein